MSVISKGDILIADLIQYVKQDDKSTSRIVSFFLGLQDAPWERLRSAALEWITLDNSYENKLTVLPRVKLEFEDSSDQKLHCLHEWDVSSPIDTLEICRKCGAERHLLGNQLRINSKNQQ